MSYCKIAYHGGLCCGIKLIHSLPANPDYVIDVKEVTKIPNKWGVDVDQHGEDVCSEWNMYYPAAPEEKAHERVKRYIDWLDVVRPNGIIEIVLTDGAECFDDQSRWIPYLLEWGFKEVNNCFNSNSSNRITVYHRNTDGEYDGLEDEEY